MAGKSRKMGRPKGSHNESNTPEIESEEEWQEPDINGWRTLFTSTTRIQFFKAFIGWRINSAQSKKLPIDVLKECRTADGKILYYYDFYGCHQYSRVLLNKLVNIPVEKLERDIKRYIRMIANDNRIVGRILQKSVGRLEEW